MRMGLLSWLRKIRLGGSKAPSNSLLEPDPPPNVRSSHELRVFYEQVLDLEITKATKKSTDPYWSSGNSNIGQDELIALDFAKSLLRRMDAFRSQSALEFSILELREKYLRFHEDFDGYGGATFYDLIRGVRGLIGDSNFEIKLEGSKSDKNIDHATSEHEEIDIYDLSHMIDDSLFHARIAMDQDDYPMAFDFIQLHIIAVVIQIEINRKKMDDADILIVSRRLNEARSICIHIAIEGRFPQFLYPLVYRYVSASTSLLAVIRENFEHDEHSSSLVGGMPFSPVALDRERATKGLQQQESERDAIPSYSEDKIHSVGLVMANKLHGMIEILSSRFIQSIFTDVLGSEVFEDEGKIVAHYLKLAIPLSTKDGVSFGPIQFEDDDKLICFVLSGNKSPIRRKITICILGKYNEIIVPITALHHSFVDSTTQRVQAWNDADRQLDFLSDILIWPIYQLIPEESDIFIVAEGMVSIVPFAALSTDPRTKAYLVKSHRIINVASPRSLLKKIRPIGDVWNIGVAFFDPDFGADVDVEGDELGRVIYEPLPGTGIEGTWLATEFNWRAVSGREATASKLIECLSSNRIVHIATHGDANLSEMERDHRDLKISPSILIELYEDAGLDSFIACAGINEDGRSKVTYSELQNLNLKQIDFAYLSLCRGGAGAAFSGEASFSLARALISCGAANVLSAIFPVADEGATEFALEFYNKIRSGESVSEALHQVQKASLVREAHWSNWSAYQSWI